MDYGPNGKKVRVRQGYRPDLCYEEDDPKDGLWMIHPMFFRSNGQTFELGAEIPNPCLAGYVVLDRKLYEEVHRKRIAPGTKFKICEGSRVVGKVIVERVF